MPFPRWVRHTDRWTLQLIDWIGLGADSVKSHILRLQHEGQGGVYIWYYFFRSLSKYRHLPLWYFHRFSLPYFLPPNGAMPLYEASTEIFLRKFYNIKKSSGNWERYILVYWYIIFGYLNMMWKCSFTLMFLERAFWNLTWSPNKKKKNALYLEFLIWPHLQNFWRCGHIENSKYKAFFSFC